MNDTKTSPTKVNQYASAHVNQEHVCFVGTDNKWKKQKQGWFLRGAEKYAL